MKPRRPPRPARLLRRAHTSDNNPTRTFDAGYRADSVRYYLPSILHDTAAAPGVVADTRARQRKPCAVAGCATPHLKGSTLCAAHEFGPRGGRLS